MEELKESRLSPVTIILAVLTLLMLVPHHVEILPMWVAHLVALAVLVPMVAISFSKILTSHFGFGSSAHWSLCLQSPMSSTQLRS